MIAFYARGSGFGHMIRSVAIARLLKDLDPVIIHDSTWTDPCEDEGLRQVGAGDARSFVENSAVDLLVVDTFPSGFNNELSRLLPKLRVPKVYVYRHLRETPTEEQLSEFDLVLLAEPDAAVEGVDACPLLVRDPLELTRYPGNIVHRPTYKSKLVYPFIERMAQSTGVVGPAGYNLFWEAKALDIPGRWSADPQRHDDQQWRIDTFEQTRGGMPNAAPYAATLIRQLLAKDA